ncbi:geminin-like [Liolophura sinensis]|uniref:geminin-like n=1 Tax=Liolophura sinensis TaxID=3198878 RepID=UPI0031583AFD
MAATGVHGQNVAGENVQVNPSAARVQTKLFDFQASSANRKSLQTLQFSSTSDKELVSKDGPIRQRVGKHSKPHKKKLIKPSQKPVTVFRDPSPPAVREEVVAVGDDEALVTGETIPDSYWKLLAEERRLALDDSLHENEMLHNEIDQLKEENSRLTELAGQAEYLATILQTAVESSGDEEDGGATEKPETSDEVEDYSSSYEVISLTDEAPPTLSDEDGETTDTKSLSDSKRESDTDTLCSPVCGDKLVVSRMTSKEKDTEKSSKVTSPESSPTKLQAGTEESSNSSTTV